MSTSKTLTVERYVGDERDIAFYVVGTTGGIEVLTGATLSCLFQSDGETDINTPITFANGDGRAHVDVAAAQVTAAIRWSIYIDGTDSAGQQITPIIGAMIVSDVP